MFETQLDEICLFPLQNKKNSFTFDDKKAAEVKHFGRAAALGEAPDDGAEDAATVDERIILSAWDFAGQPEYAAGQQQYLIQGALSLAFSLLPSRLYQRLR